MKGFKHIAVDELPAEWQPKHFSQLTSFRMGKTPPRNRDEYWEKGVYPWVSIADMEPFGTVLGTKEKVSEKAHEHIFRGTLVPTGSILMSFKLTIGRVAKLGIPAYHNEAIISLNPDRTQVDPDYLFYHLAQINYRDYQDTAVKGQTLNKGKLERLEVVLPPQIEQRKIASVLSLVQRAIEQQERLIALTAELKKSLMHKLFTEGLHGKSQKQTEIGPIPNEWEVVTIGGVCDLGTGTTPSTKNADYYSGEVPFVKTAEIMNNRITHTETKVSRQAVQDCHLKVYPPGTVLMAMYGQGKTRGQVGLLEIGACTTQNSAAIQSRGGMDPEFLWQYLKRRYGDLRGAGAVGHISHLNLGYLGNFKIIKPSLIEQGEIASILRTVDERISRSEAKQRLLQDLFRTLLHQLMTAQIRVHDLDLSFLEQEAVAS